MSGAVLSSSRDHLYMLGGVAAVIGQRPGAGNDLFPFTSAGIDYISVRWHPERCRSYHASSVTSPVIEGSAS